jgi:HK97 family phage major capsid protein
MNIKELREKMKAALVAARTICDEAEKAGRDLNADERVKVQGYVEEAGKLKVQVKTAEGDDALRKALDDLGVGIETTERKAATGGGKGRTIGEQFVNAKSFQEWMERFPSGRIPDSAKGLMSPPVELKADVMQLLGRKALITGDSDTSAGAFVQTDYTGIYEPLGRQPLTLMDLINKRTTTSDVLEFVRQTTKVTQAAPVAEANVTTYSGSTGQVSGEKPEATMAFEKVTETVKTIAVWVPATKRALSDAGQIRGIIDQELREDLAEELEDQILNGNGAGENFTGVFATSGHLHEAWDTSILKTCRKAKTTVRMTGRAIPTAYVFNPEDWEAIELLQDGNNQYYFGGPFASGPRTLWGTPVVESETITAGTGMLADWRKAVYWDRERATLQVSDSHADFFIRNMVAFLMEIRGAFGLIKPSAFVEIDLDAS